MSDSTTYLYIRAHGSHVTVCWSETLAVSSWWLRSHPHSPTETLPYHLLGISGSDWRRRCCSPSLPAIGRGTRWCVRNLHPGRCHTGEEESRRLSDVPGYTIQPHSTCAGETDREEDRTVMPTKPQSCCEGIITACNHFSSSCNCYAFKSWLNVAVWDRLKSLFIYFFLNKRSNILAAIFYSLFLQHFMHMKSWDFFPSTPVTLYPLISYWRQDTMMLLR